MAHSFFNHPSWALQLYLPPPCGQCTLSCWSWALIDISTSVGKIYPHASLLQGQANHWPIPQNRTYFIRALVPTGSVPWVWCYGGGRVVFQCVLKLSTGCTGSEAFQDVQANVSHHLGSAWGNQHKLQRDLQMAATCAGLGGVQVRPGCELKLASTSARSGAI